MILITGATGFIGSRLAEIVHESGSKLILLGRQNSDAEIQRGQRLRSLGLDLHDVDLVGDDLHEYVDGVQLIIHLAAAQHEANRPESYFENINVLGTRRLLDASVIAGAKRFVYGSTIGVYGNVVSGRIDANTAETPDNHYGRSKLAAEKTVTEFSDQIEVSIARISETYGPGDYRLLKLFSGIRKGLFFIVGNGRNLHQLIYVDDLVNAILEMSESDAAIGQTIVLSGDEAMTTTEMCETIGAAVGRPVRKIRVPMWPFVVLAIVLEQTLGRVGIQPPLHRRRLDFFRKSLSFSVEKRNSILKWRPAASFSAGTTETAQWYIDNGFLDEQ